MSTLSERVTVLRQHLALTRQGMADAAGINAHTLVNIELKGQTPGGDILHKLAVRWPECAFWLVTGLDPSDTQHQLVIGERKPFTFEGINRLEIVDKVDMHAPEDSIIRPNCFEALVFVRDSADIWSALLIIDQRADESSRQAVLIDDWTTNVSSGIGSKNKKPGLLNFKYTFDWAKRNGIQLFGVYSASNNDIYEIYSLKKNSISTGVFVDPDSETIDHFNKLLTNELNYDDYN